MKKTKSKLSKNLSIIIPVLNEEKIIEKTLEQAVSYLKRRQINGEVIVVDNGSEDRTLKILNRLGKKYPTLRVFNMDAKNKGLALKEGMFNARGKLLVLIDADLWDGDFVDSCIKLLKKYDVVVGSKVVSGSKDGRPLSSRIVSRLYNLLFKVTFGFKGTETHAKLSFRNDKIMPLVEKCKTDGLVFDTELIIRAERAGLKKKEIPTEVYEIRARRFSINQQLSQVARNYMLLIKALKFGR